MAEIEKSQGNMGASAFASLISPTQATGRRPRDMKPTSESTAEFKPMTAEEQEKQRKNRKWELVAGAIGEGISALTNLFFTTKGAPSAYGNAKNNKKGSDYISLIDRIYGKHQEQDKDYNDRISEWEKQQEKLNKEAEERRKAAEKERIENDRVEIHEKYNPKSTNWDQDGYIDFIFDKFQKEIEKKTTKVNDTKEEKYQQDALSCNDASFAGTILPGEKYPNKTKIWEYINSYFPTGKGKKYSKQDIMERILSGEEKFELDDEYLDQLRELLQEYDDNFVK